MFIELVIITTDIQIIPKVEKILIEDFGVIKKADINFSPGLNIIIGKNATGKTTFIRYLTETYSTENLSKGNKIMLDIDSVLDGTIVIDGNLDRLNNEFLIKALKKLADSKRQVIVTLARTDRLDDIKKEVKANIIDTRDFELKKDLD